MSATWSLICFTTQRGRGRQRCDQRKRARKLLDGFNQRRARQRPLSGLTPQTGRFLDQASLGAVTSQNLRLVLGDVSELTFEDVRDVSMKSATRLSQQRSVGRVLHKRMLEQIRGVWRDALPEQQTSSYKTVERRLEFHLRLSHYRS